MRRYILSWVLVAFVFAFSSVAIAQNHYQTTGGYARYINLKNCQTHNCLLLTNTGATVGFLQLASGTDGYVLALGPAYGVWQLTPSTTVKPQWTFLSAMGTVHGLAILDRNNIYGLGASCGSAYSSTNGSLLVTPGGYQVQAWEGSSWRLLGMCAGQISIGHDNTLAAHTNTGGVYYTSNPTAATPTWTAFPSAWSAIYVITSNLGFALSGSTIYYVNLLAGTSSVVPGAPSVSSMTVTQDGYIYAVALTAGSHGNLYNAYVESTTQPAWVNLTGTVNSIWGGVSDAIFALTNSPTTGSPYHFLATALAFTTTVSGYYDCSRFVSGCPSGSVHTVTATTKFLHGYTPGSASSSGPPATTLSARFTDVSGNCDLFFGDPTSPDCQVTEADSNENCSVMGSLGGSSVASPPQEQFGFGSVLLENLSEGVGQNCFSLFWTGLSICHYPVTQWCTNTPKWTTNEVIELSYYGNKTPAWWAHYKCYKDSSGGITNCYSPLGNAYPTTQVGPTYCPNP